MQARVLVAGATGAIGRRLTQLLARAGYEVFGTTRYESKAQSLLDAGVIPVVVELCSRRARARAGGDQHTAAYRRASAHPIFLPASYPARMAEAVPRNARVRTAGTRNLVDAALRAGAQRLVAQSIAWLYAPGGEPHAEEDPLVAEDDGPRGVTLHGVKTLEALTLGSPPHEGLVLRYGQIYGPGTGSDGPRGEPGRARGCGGSCGAACVERGSPGLYKRRRGQCGRLGRRRRGASWAGARTFG